ncbi:MAG: hypothetical protein QNJ46_18910 [Leptolyngbyaceae cyanobacterium MO_188.B28]|nr:hypothetical protein [Leptolyngbyaceae cyanobacterium MO_188.B28]
MQTWHVIETLKQRLPELAKELPGIEFNYQIDTDAFQICWRGQVVGRVFADGMLNLDLMHTKSWATFQHSRPQRVRALYASLEQFLKDIKKYYNPNLLEQLQSNDI